MKHFWGSSEIMSAHGGRIDTLNWAIHALMAVLFVGWLVYFIFVLIRFRQSRNAAATGGIKSHFSTYLEVGVAATEAVLLAGLAIPIWKFTVEDFPPENQSTVIEVMGRQFNWTAHYGGTDGVLGKKDPQFVTASDPFGVDRKSAGAADDIIVMNDFVVPVNKPVIVKLTSLDVIHSFGVRPMRIAQDAIPGMMIPLHFTPVKTGTNVITCIQLCGNSHYAMRGSLAVVTEPEFNDWVKNKSAGAANSNVSYE